MDKKNVCFLVGSFRSGGAENHVMQIVKNLDDSKYQPFLCVFYDEGDLEHKFEELGVPVHVINGYKSKFKRKFFKYFAFFPFVSFLKKNKIDVIHVHLVGCFLFGLYTSYFAGIKKKLITWHNIYDNSIREWKFDSSIYFNLRTLFRIKMGSVLANKIIAVSGDVKNKNCRYYGIKDGKVVVVYNGISSFEFTQKTFESNDAVNQEFTMGAVGTLQHQKDFITMIDVVKELSNKFPKIRLHIMGEGPERKNLEGRIQKHGLEEHVILKGNVKNVPDALRACDLFLMTSLWEGFSIALLEAMAVGMPIVATSVGGNSEAIVHEKTGLLVPVKEVATISAAIESLILDPKKTEEYGKSASIRFHDNFTIDKMMENLGTVYSA